MGSDNGLTTSADRLWKLIDQRTKVGADTAVIDQRIWDLFGEEWAIMFTDLSGFSRQVAKFGIVHFLQIIFEQEKLLLPVVESHDGILVKIEADSFLILFKKPARAVACAVAMQRVCHSVNARRPPEEQIILCVGVGFGRVLKIGDEDVYGNEVNLASKLGEDTAKGNEILVTPAAREAIGELHGVTWEPYAVKYVNEELCFRVGYTG
ncbi:MAG: putative adenylate/guanylate cyclase [Myxococcales bacterium]|nr:putative adenylate/guanylate cyclase [Myxococcales bacterium]